MICQFNFGLTFNDAKNFVMLLKLTFQDSFNTIVKMSSQRVIHLIQVLR